MKIKLGIITFFYFLYGHCTFANGQNKIDSLLNLVNHIKDDSLKAELYLGISNEYWSFSPVQCMEYAKMALVISKKINSHNLKAGSYRNMGKASTFIGKIEDALHYDRLSLTEAFSAGNEKSIMKACINLGSDYTSFSKFDSSDFILDLGIRLAKKNSDKKQLCALYVNKGNNLYYQSKFDSCEKYYQEGLKESLILNDTNRIVNFYNNIAGVRLQRGISDSTVVNYLMKAIQINEKKKNYFNLGDCYTTLASAYNVQGNHEKAIMYLKKGIKAFESLPNEKLTVNLFVSMADQFRELKCKDSATFYANIAIEKGEKNQFRHGLAAAYCIKGAVLSENLKLDSAELYLQKAFVEFHKNKDGEGISLSGYYLANVLAKQGKYKEAEKIASTVFQLSDTTKNYQGIRNVAKLLSEIFHEEGNDAKSLEYLNYYIVAVDTINNQRNARLLADMATKYEAEKKEKENIVLGLDNENLKLKNENERSKRNNLIVVFFSGAVLFFFGLTRYFQKRRKKKIVEIRESFSRNLHDDLSNKITVIENDSNEIGNQLFKNNELNHSVLRECIDRIGNCCVSFNEAMHDIVWASKAEDMTIEDLMVKIEDYRKSISESFKIEIISTITCNKPDSIISSLYAYNILNVVKESINNSAKYSKAALIQLNAEMESKNFKFEINDNGNGFNIYEKKLAGNGLTNMQCRIEKMGGKFSIHSHIDIGTKIVFSGKFFNAKQFK